MISTGQLSYELLKTLIQMYEDGEIDEDNPLLAPGVDNIKKELKRYEKIVLKKDD